MKNISSHCPKCGRQTNLEDYHKNDSSATGRAYHCKICMREKARDYARKKRAAKRTTTTLEDLL